MKRKIVLYRDARGKECICEAEEFDAVWADHPGVQLIERGMGMFDKSPQDAMHDRVRHTLRQSENAREQQHHVDMFKAGAPEFDDTAPQRTIRGRVGKNAHTLYLRALAVDLSTQVGAFRLPNNARLIGASYKNESDDLVKLINGVYLHFHVDDIEDTRSFIKRFVFAKEGRYPVAVRGCVLDYTTPVHFETPEGTRYYVFPIVEIPEPA